MAHPFKRAAVGAVGVALTLVPLPGWVLVAVAARAERLGRFGLAAGVVAVWPALSSAG